MKPRPGASICQRFNSVNGRAFSRCVRAESAMFRLGLAHWSYSAEAARATMVPVTGRSAGEYRNSVTRWAIRPGVRARVDAGCGRERMIVSDRVTGVGGRAVSGGGRDWNVRKRPKATRPCQRGAERGRGVFCHCERIRRLTLTGRADRRSAPNRRRSRQIPARSFRGR